jgi:hypothetical protein
MMFNKADSCVLQRRGANVVQRQKQAVPRAAVG